MEGLGAWVLRAALDVFGKADPRVLALLIYRDLGRWELRTGKGAHRNGNKIVVPFFRVVHRRTAVGTEVKGKGAAFVAYPYELLGLTLNDDALDAKPRLR